jgi:Flp pilus assembly pilin Flp
MLDLLAPIRRRAVEDDGQTMAEYSVVLSVVTLAALGALALLGAHVISSIERVAAML